MNAIMLRTCNMHGGNQRNVQPNRDVWCVVCGVWCVVCGVWCVVVCGVWCAHKQSQYCNQQWHTSQLAPHLLAMQISSVMCVSVRHRVLSAIDPRGTRQEPHERR